MLSVVIPLYNKEQTIGRALRSVLQQTCQEFEIIVVNDGSSDGSVAEVEKFQDARIRLIHQSNAGVSAARNRGIHEAKSETVAFLDADDEWHPTFVATCNRLAQRFPECGLYATAYEIAIENGPRRSCIICGLPQAFDEGILPAYFTIAAASEPPVWSSAVMMRRNALAQIGGFPPEVALGEDLLTWARMSVRWPFAYSRQPCATFWRPNSKVLRQSMWRRPEAQDLVGQGLIALLDAVPAAQRRSLTLYISKYYRMRGTSFLMSAAPGSARKMFLRSLRHHPLGLGAIVLYAITFLPRTTAAQVRFIAQQLKLRSRRMF